MTEIVIDLLDSSDEESVPAGNAAATSCPPKSKSVQPQPPHHAEVSKLVPTRPTTTTECPVANCVSAYSNDRVLLDHIIAFHAATVFWCAPCRRRLDNAEAAVQHTVTRHRSCPRVLQDHDHRTGSGGGRGSGPNSRGAGGGGGPASDEDSDLEILEEKRPVLPDYQCKKCAYHTHDHKAYFEHCSKHSDLRFHCSFCPFVCSTYRQIMQHRTTKHREIRPVLSCRFQCGERSTDRERIAKHEATCASRSHRYLCMRCQFRTLSADAYATHCKSVAHLEACRKARLARKRGGAGTQKRRALGDAGIGEAGVAGSPSGMSSSSSTAADVSIKVNFRTGDIKVNGELLPPVAAT